MKRDLWILAFGVVIGLCAAGVLYMISGHPRGQPVQLLPPPTPAPIMVSISGGVSQPGLYALPIDSRVQDAIQAAGGLVPEANGITLNLAARLEDGDQLIIPTLAPTRSPVAQIEAGGVRAQATPPAGLPTSSSSIQTTLININTASLEELDSLPGIGPATAQKIIDYRTTSGPFETIESIIEVDGIGPVTYARIKDLISVGP
jgi:competence protein ComEA